MIAALCAVAALIGWIAAWRRLVAWLGPDIPPITGTIPARGEG